jgi:hypothetical protein
MKVKKKNNTWSDDIGRLGEREGEGGKLDFREVARGSKVRGNIRR